MSEPVEIQVEDREATVIGNLMHISIERLEQLKKEVFKPNGCTWGIRRYAKHMVKSIHSLDSIFFKMHRGQSYPKELTRMFMDVLLLRDELMDELLAEVRKTTISKERLKEILERLASELIIYFLYIDTFNYLKGDYDEGEELIIEDEEEEEPEEEHISYNFSIERIRELLTPREYDDGLVEHAKQTLSDLLADPNYRGYLFNLTELLMENGDDEVLESQIRSIDGGEKSAIARELKRMGVISSRGRGRWKYVTLNPPYSELMFMLFRELTAQED